MIAWTTPTLTLRVKHRDLTGCTATVSVKQRGTVIKREAESVTLDGSDTLISVTYTQRETGKLKGGDATVQLNCAFANDRRVASWEKAIRVGGNHIEREL